MATYESILSPELLALYGVPLQGCATPVFFGGTRCGVVDTRDLRTTFVAHAKGQPGYTIAETDYVKIDGGTENECNFATVDAAIKYCNAKLPPMTDVGLQMRLKWDDIARTYCRVYAASQNAAADLQSIVRANGIDGAVATPDIQVAQKTVLFTVLLQQLLSFMWHGDSALTQTGTPGTEPQPDGLITQALLGGYVDPTDPNACDLSAYQANTIDWAAVTGVAPLAPLTADITAGQSTEINNVPMTMPETSFIGLVRWIVTQHAFLSGVGLTDWVLYVPSGGAACLSSATECWQRCCINPTDTAAIRRREDLFARERVIDMDGVTVRVVETGGLNNWVLLPNSATYSNGYGNETTLNSLNLILHSNRGDNFGIAESPVVQVGDTPAQRRALGNALLDFGTQKDGVKCWVIAGLVSAAFRAENTRFWYIFNNIDCAAGC